LFLDEIGELPLAAQAKLFRFLDTGTFRRVGSGRDEEADVRLLAASNQDLCDTRIFRHELYYRLSQVTLQIPPLAGRGEDILHIARRVLQELNERHSSCKEFSPESEERLLAYDWPGNVRELRQTVERAWHESPYIIRPDHIHLLPVALEKTPQGSEWTPDLDRDELDLERETCL
ncbi:MAG: sigma-54-dependent Fis family transcriptional regulator, partial [Candidatus Cloacimonetes bacterium]|nr:sigma-54-dependent Fis family transcriptional regulator [Candidatus Cloacimonadota bacterium]